MRTADGPRKAGSADGSSTARPLVRGQSSSDEWPDCAWHPLGQAAEPAQRGGLAQPALLPSVPPEQRVAAGPRKAPSPGDIQALPKGTGSTHTWVPGVTGSQAPCWAPSRRILPAQERPTLDATHTAYRHPPWSVLSAGSHHVGCR